MRVAATPVLVAVSCCDFRYGREIPGQARNEEREARNEAIVKHGMREGLWQEMVGHAFALWGVETWPTWVYG